MSHRSFPLSTFALFPSPFKPALSAVEGGKTGRGMVLTRAIREASRRP